MFLETCLSKPNFDRKYNFPINLGQQTEFLVLHKSILEKDNLQSKFGLE